MTTSGQHSTTTSKRVPLAIALSVASLGLIAAAFATGEKSQPSAPAESRAKDAAPASSTTWNVALGNVVVFAPDLGFKAMVPGETKIDPPRVAGKVESQLASLRQLYREESERDPALLGSLTLRLTLGDGGEVKQVKRLSGPMRNHAFSKAVAEQAAHWNFAELAPAGTVIETPLLFVRQGMDITTALNWEKALRGLRADLK
jgi:hypothetical protein